MQVGVQGAWGVVPAHLNELSPDAVRSLFKDLFAPAGSTIWLARTPLNTHCKAISVINGR
jgi:SHS family lactate transporter-like MFS transporter